MRSALVIAALVCAASAARAEETRESRYGPTALRPSVSLTGSNYGGPILGWAGKQDIAPPAQAPARASAPDLRPMATPWRQLGAIQQPRREQPAQQAYAAPRPMQAPAQMAPPQVPQATAPAAAAYPQPQASMAHGPPQFPSQLAGQTQGARTYSVGRQYGMIPDAIPPAPPNGMVFIAPSDEPRASKKDEEPRHGSVEWLAQAPMDAAEDDDAKRDTAKSDSH